MNATPNSDPVSADNFRLGLFLGNNVSAGANDFVSIFSNDDVGAADRWVFLAVTYNGTIAADNIRFYIGGPSTPVMLVGTPLTTLQLTIDAGPARAGVGFTDAAPTANTSAIGLQDDVRVYGSALDSAALDQIRLANLVPEPSAALLAGMRSPSRRLPQAEVNAACLMLGRTAGSLSFFRLLRPCVLQRDGAIEDEVIVDASLYPGRSKPGARTGSARPAWRGRETAPASRSPSRANAG
jgi:hypothetical protein